MGLLYRNKTIHPSELQPGLPGECPGNVAVKKGTKINHLPSMGWESEQTL